MAYRFTSTEKWQTDEWFIELEKDQKLMFLYLVDNCDVAGFYELSTRKMAFDLRMTPEEVKAAFKGIQKCYILSSDSRVIYLRNFLKHQKCLPLNELNKMHIGIFKRFDLQRSKFGVDDILENLKLSSNHVNIKGHESPKGKGIVKGIGNDIKGGAGGKIDFTNFWDLYARKIGDKDKCEKKWNLLSLDTQTKILKVLPEWKKMYPVGGWKVQPYPETFLNQKRWNDEIIIEEVKQPQAEFPDFYDRKLEVKLSITDNMRYYKHLRGLGFKAVKTQEGVIVNWAKG